MTTHHSSVTGKEVTVMKSKPLTIIVIVVALFAGAAMWIYFSWNKEAGPASTQVTADQSNPEKSTGHQWFSNITNTSKPDGSKTKLSIFKGGDGKYVDVNGTTVTQYVNGLRAAADKGDTLAEYNIYSAETYCTGVVKRQRVYNTQPTDTEQAFCKDFNFSPKERLDYLNMAAKGGNNMALVTFGTEAPEWLSQDPESGVKDPRYTAWTQQAFNYNQQAAQQGSSIAMFMLGDSYARGLGVQQNYQLAVTYDLAFRALSYTNKDLTTIPPNPNYAEQLTPDEIAQARSAAAALIKSIPH
ncbi:tetratricopeptide repeat protein [Solimicrobium silvestre]|uniref:Sel1 repeat n=1 Tax=Solimicrobium silvestre TaxID=2099400 RepID=A0A2S9H336_9BURK|nr:sel1 repeat family protein [Solimicrobium silvestre]PRC94367.1 hypothetical protein S2091_0988 [Solimicrobium silvestre]